MAGDYFSQVIFQEVLNWENLMSPNILWARAYVTIIVVFVFPLGLVRVKCHLVAGLVSRQSMLRVVSRISAR